ncbi:MAG: site-specific integrase [Chryseolinea sp.]
MNTHLDTLQSSVYEAQRQLIPDSEDVTIDNLGLKLEGKRARPKMLVDVFKEHNEKMKQLVNKDFSEGTLERYETALMHTISFLQWKFKISDIDIQELNHEFVTEMEFWLKSVRNVSHNTAVKYINNVKKIINICLKNGWLNKDPFLGYKMNKREVVLEILTEEEITTMGAKIFATDSLAFIRDLFLFNCYTGLAYADVKN